MAEDFTGKVALVSGGNGIGAATCRAFAAAGAQVAIVDRDMAAAEAVAVEITRHNGHAAAHGLDVADRDAFARLAEAVNVIRLGETSKEYTQLLHRGSGGSMYTRNARATREAPMRDQG